MLKNNGPQKELTAVWWLLKITYGLYWGIIGFDKFFGFVTESEKRVSGYTLNHIPVGLPRLLHIVGILEILIAFLILTHWPKLGTFFGIILMGVIVANLIAMGTHYDIAIHGTTIGIGMVAFLVLTWVLKK